MREQNYNEKLRARYEAPSKSKKLEPNTLLPTLEVKLLFLLVSKFDAHVITIDS